MCLYCWFIGDPETEREAVNGPPPSCIQASWESADQCTRAEEGRGPDVLWWPDAGWWCVWRKSESQVEGRLEQDSTANPGQADESKRGQGQTPRSGSFSLLCQSVIQCSFIDCFYLFTMKGSVLSNGCCVILMNDHWYSNLAKEYFFLWTMLFDIRWKICLDGITLQPAWRSQHEMVKVERSNLGRSHITNKPWWPILQCGNEGQFCLVL